MKISIITVSYNSISTIRNTFDSVLNQTYSNIEYIIIDGKSTDGTVEIIKKYEPQFKGRMIWISQPDRGLYDAMNKGIKMATGDIIGILNSDDFFSSDKIVENIAKSFANKNLDAVYGDIKFVNPSDTTKTVRYYSSKIFKIWLFRFGFMPAHPSFYVKRSIYEKYGLYELDYKIAADYDLLIRYLYKYKIKTKYIPICLVTMRTGGASTADLNSRITLNKEIIKACKKYGIYTNIFFLSLKYFYKIFELRR